VCIEDWHGADAPFGQDLDQFLEWRISSR